MSPQALKNIRFTLLFFLGILFATSNSEAQVIIPFAYWNTHCVTNVSNTNNNVLTGFGAGTKTNLTPTGNTLVLSAGQTTGTYLSPPFYFQDCLNYPLKTIAWTTSLPYGKELPATSETTTDYSAIITNLATSIAGIWHFNEISGITFADTSGSGVTGTSSGGVTVGLPGKFQNSITLNGSTGYVNFGTTSAVTAMGNYSISLWIYPTSFASNQGIINRTDNDSQQGYILHLLSTGTLNFLTVFGTTDAERQTSTTLTLNQWNHVVVTSDATVTAANAHIYINGVEAAYSTTVNGSGAHSSPTGQNMVLGFPQVTVNVTTSNYFAGKIDELGMWNRILTAAEALQLFRRGINRIKFQVRNCVQANCSDNPPWKGPDGSSTSFFTEINNNTFQNLSTGSVVITAPNLTFSNFLSLGLINSRAFQYQAIFETDNTTYLPDLQTVNINH